MELRTWERNGYTVEMVEWDYNLKAFEVDQHGHVIATIAPATFEDMKEIIEALDNGDDVNGWEDGAGNAVTLIEDDLYSVYDYLSANYNIDGENEAYATLIEDYEDIDPEEKGFVEKLNKSISDDLKKLNYPIIFFESPSSASGLIIQSGENIKFILDEAIEYFEEK